MLIEAMFQHLESPNLTEPASFWFTDAGLIEFADAIIYIITAIEPYNWTLIMAKTDYDIDAPEVLYKDDYQVAIAYECHPDNPEDYNTVKPYDLTNLITKISENEE